MHILQSIGIRRLSPASASFEARPSAADPAVLLVHDWSGLPDSMGPLATELAEHHYRSIRMGFIPAPAEMSGFQRVSRVADEIIKEVRRVGPVFAIVANGLAAAAVLLALTRERIACDVVLVGLDPEHRDLRRFAHQLGDVHGLLIHSADDATATLHDALEIAEAWPNSILSRVEGLGHRSVLAAASTRSLMLRFLDMHRPIQAS